MGISNEPVLYTLKITAYVDNSFVFMFSSAPTGFKTVVPFTNGGNFFVPQQQQPEFFNFLPLNNQLLMLKTSFYNRRVVNPSVHSSVCNKQLKYI